MRKAVRAIIVKDDQLLVMNRNKFGQIYFTLLGGKIDLGETPEQAVIREVKEESGLDIKNPQLTIIEDAGDPFGLQYIYRCDLVGDTTPKLSPDSIEAKIAQAGENLYVPMWLQVSDLPASPFLSENLKQTLIKCLKDGFPEEVINLHSNAEIRYNGNSDETKE